MSPSSPKTNGAVRLVASDLDGTLMRADDSVSEHTLAALARTVAAGIRFVLVSARAPGWLAPAAAQLGLDGIGICCNGAVVYDYETERILIHRPLDPEIARALVDELRQAAPGLAIGCERPSGFTAEPAYIPLFRPPDSIPRADVAELLATPLTKLVLQHPSLPQPDLHALAAELGGEQVEACYSGAGLVEIAAPGVTKGTALAELCAQLEITAAEVVAFGDMLNDIPMLIWAGRGVAVENAHPDVLEVADEITLSNDDDGVAVVLEEMVTTR